MIMLSVQKVKISKCQSVKMAQRSTQGWGLVKIILNLFPEEGPSCLILFQKFDDSIYNNGSSVHLSLQANSN